MPIRVELRVGSGAAIAAKLRALEGLVAIGPARAKALKLFAAVGLAEVQKIFRAGGIPKWTPLAPSTVLARRAGRGSRSPVPLQDTGALRASADARAEPPNRAVVFFRSVLALYHHFGTGVHGRRGAPYPIVPRFKQALAWPGSPFSLRYLRNQRARRGKGGSLGQVPARTTIVRLRVLHPGVPPRPLLPTPDQMRAAVLPPLRRLIARELARQGGTG